MAAAAPKKAKHSKTDQVQINIGLQQVYPDPDDPTHSKHASELSLDIVAIPGLGANPEWTWIRDKVHWLRDSTMLPRKVPNARISVFQYQSQWFGKGSVDQQLDNVCDQLLYQLKRTRGDDCKTPIIFVCHCLGGIVLEKTLLSARLRQNTFPSIFPWVAGCIFLGTPFRGTKSSEKARVLAGMAETFGMGVQTSLLKLLEKDSDTLVRMLDEFVKLINDARIKAFCFFESEKSDLASLFIKGLPFKTQELIVDKDSAAYPGSESLQLASDHFKLNKYTGPKDGNFVAVSNEIQATANKAALILRSRKNDRLQSLIKDRTYHAIIDTLGKGFADIDATVTGSNRGTKKDQNSWIVEIDQYQTWKAKTEPQLLWVHGKAGTGQSAIATSTTKDVSATMQSGSIVASFFCDQGDENRRSLAGMLKLIVRQIIMFDQDLAVHLLGDTKKARKSGPHDFDPESLSKVHVLWEALLAMSKDLTAGHIYIVLYGIEHLSRESLNEFLPLLKADYDENHSDSNQSCIKWLLLSRSGRPDIEKSLKPLAAEININNDENAELVSNALKADISVRVNELELASPLAYFAKQHVHSRAGDNYIYVSLVLQELKNARISGKTTHAEFRSLLESFPYGLTEMFEHIRKRVLDPKAEGIEYTKEILRCLVVALHAPTMRELAVMADLPHDMRYDNEQIRGYIVRCGAFLTLRGNELDEDSMTVEWIDISAQEHLEKFAKEDLSLDLKDMQHGIIALRCLEYVYQNTAEYEAIQIAGQKASEYLASLEAEAEQNDGELEAHEPTTGGDAEDDAGAFHQDHDDEEHYNTEQNEQNLDEHHEGLTETALSVVPAEDVEDEDDDDDDDDDGDDPDTEYVYLHYAFQYWMEHAKLAPTDVIEEFGTSHSFWDDESSLRESWWVQCADIHPFEGLTDVSPLHIGAIAGFSAFVEYLLKEGRSHNISHIDSEGFQPLYYACLKGDLEIVDMLLQAGADINHVTEKGAVLGLFSAASHGHKEMVEFLLDKGAQIDFNSEEYGTALYAASEDNFPEIVQLLLDRGANVNLVGGFDKRAINAAAYNGDYESVLALLEHGADVDPEEEYIYGSALGAAARRGHADVAKLLLSKGWSPSRSIKTYGSFLTVAATYGHVDVVELLVRKEARITVLEQALQAASQNGKADVVKLILDRTPTLRHQKAFSLAANFGRNEVLELLHPRGISKDQLDICLYNAADREHEHTIRLLLDYGADANAEGAEYGTALTASAYDGTKPILEALLEKGADVNKRGGNYGTALQAAALFGSEDIVRILLDHGAEVNTEPIGMYGSALQAACYTGDLETIQLLLERGADVNAYGGEYKYAIIAAIEQGHTSTIKLLLEHNANVNVRGGTDNRPVVVAAGASLATEDLEMILDHGADPNAHCEQGTTALIQCAYASDSEGIRFLLSRGADVHIVSKQLGTALHAAAAAADPDSCDVLINAGADVNAIGGYYGTSLQAAAFAHDISTVQVLLKAGADVGLIAGEYGSALQAAAFSGDAGVVQELLDHSSATDSSEAHGSWGYPLQAAAIGGHMDILTLLLDHGVDVNGCGGQHGYALLAAASRRSNDECVQLLLDRGADATVTGGLLGSVIQAAAYGNNFHVLEVLIERGAIVNSSGGKYGSALQAACVKADLNFVEALLTHGANVSLIGGKYHTALQAAAYADKLDIVNRLLDCGADFRLRGGRYDSALTAAAVKGHKGILERLLSLGPPEQMLDEALVEACYNRQTSSVETLLKSGANVYARHPLLGSPADALKAEQPDGYNSDDEVDAANDQDDEDEEDDDSDDEDDTWEGDDQNDEDDDSEGSVTDLQLEDEVSEDIKIEKLLQEAMARVKRNPSVRRFRTVKRRGMPTNYAAGPPPTSAQSTTNYAQPYSTAPMPTYDRQSYPEKQAVSPYPGTEQAPMQPVQGSYFPPPTNSGFVPYRASMSQSRTPPNQFPATPPLRKPLPPRNDGMQPTRQYSAGSSDYGMPPSGPPRQTSQDSLLHMNQQNYQPPPPQRTSYSNAQPQPQQYQQSSQDWRQSQIQYASPPQSSQASPRPPPGYGQPTQYGSAPGSQHNTPPPMQSPYNNPAQPPQRQYTNPAQGTQYSSPAQGGLYSNPVQGGQYSNPTQGGQYVPYNHGSQSTSQSSFQSTQYANSSDKQSGYANSGTPNSSRSSTWGTNNQTQSTKPMPQNRWQSGGYDGAGYG